MPEGANQETVLVWKAAADAIAVRELAGNPEITDEIIGFHAQQAIEKWLKALMAHRAMDEVRIQTTSAAFSSSCRTTAPNCP